MEFVLAGIGALVGMAGVYLAVLTLAQSRAKPFHGGAATRHITVLIPAHNETRNIRQAVKSIQAQDYPSQLRRILVVADNCTDDTASQARALGAQVLERTHETDRGKGFAVRAGVQHALDGRDEQPMDALVVMDADSLAHPDMLMAFDAQLSQGAQVVQGYHGVLNAHGGDYAKLMDVAYTLFHLVRSRGREALGLSAGLRGNGMCFTTHALETLPGTTSGLVEDVEQGILLGLAGERVHFAQHAVVLAEMPLTTSQAGTQRQRWEQGRMSLVRTYVPQLLKDAWRRKSRVSLDLALDLLVPPLGTLVAVLAAGLVTTSVGMSVAGWSVLAVLPWAAGMLGVVMHVVVGLVSSPRGWTALLDLRLAPRFLVWKLRLALASRPTTGAVWVRTARQGEV